MGNEKFTWVKTHHALVEFISGKRSKQTELINLLRKVGISGLHDEMKQGKRIDLTEIDPFSFFCFIYKHGPDKRLKLLQNIARELNLPIPTDDWGIPAVNAQKVCLFPFSYERKNNEINRLWNFFEHACDGKISEGEFADILTIKGVGKAKLTEGLFNILPDKYFPLNGPSRPYLKEVMNIDSDFESFTDYLNILKKIHPKAGMPFYELSYEAWKWNNAKNNGYYVIGSRYGQNNNVDVSQQMIDESIVAVGFASKINLSKYFNNSVDQIKKFLESKGESQGSKNALKLFLSLKVGDKIAIKASGSPRGKSPFLSIIAIAEVVEKNGAIYEYKPNGLIHTVHVKYLQTNIYKELPLGGYGATIHKVNNDEHIHDIFETENPPAAHSEFEKIISKYTKEDVELYLGFLRKVIQEYSLRSGDERIVFSLSGGQSRLVFTVGQRYCLTLDKEADHSVFGVISTKKINRGGTQFDGKEPRPYYSLLDSNQFKAVDKSNILDAIQNELERSKKSSFLKFNNTDFENYVFQKKSQPPIKTTLMNLALNTIIYGPPGTGKTFMLKNEYMKMFTSSENATTKEEFLLDIIQHCSWWQVIALALRELGRAKVAAIQEHPYVKLKTRLSNSSSITQTIWGQLQSHTIPECSEVKVQRRMGALFFNKTEDSFWEVVDAQLIEQAPEILELENKIKQFAVYPKTSVKRYEFITFHQSYSYEDFVEGIKPSLDDTEVSYKIEEGIFLRMCNRARNDRANNYAIFIDEINRGNISSIFGELITLIEEDKRDGNAHAIEATLPYSKQPFSVPSNLYIIGTMNTADRSVEALDTALRRRFSFIELNPDPSKLALDEYACTGVDLKKVLVAINARIEKLLDKDYCIGHSYFMNIKDRNNPLSELQYIFQNKILPLLQEYFYGDWGKIMLVLGDEFVQKKTSSTAFLSIDRYENYEDFEDKPIYTFTSMHTWTLNSFRKIYE